jgi:hypothetical protein
MADWLRDLETLPERADDRFRGVVKRGANNVKVAWRAGWEAIQSTPTHIPHLPRGIGYDTDFASPRWSAEIGVSRANSQSPLAHLIEFGSVNNPPHPAGQAALDAETPKFVRAVIEAGEELLTGD